MCVYEDDKKARYSKKKTHASLTLLTRHVCVVASNSTVNFYVKRRRGTALVKREITEHE